MDMESLMAKAQDIQKQIHSAQDSLAKMHVKGIADNGMVVVDMTGKYDLVSVTINPDALGQGAPKVSELVADAYRDAKAKADVLIDDIMGKVSSGFPMMN